MIFYLVFLVLNALLLIGLIKQKKKIPIILGSIAEIALLCLLVLRVINISLTPTALLIVYIAVPLLCVFEIFVLLYKKRKILFIVSSVICVLYIAAVSFLYLAYKQRTVDSTDYMAVYSKFTGITETKVDYHYMYNGLFMNSNVSFTENYGVLLCGYEDIFNYEPYSVDYREVDNREIKNLSPEELSRYIDCDLTCLTICDISAERDKDNSDTEEFKSTAVCIKLNATDEQLNEIMSKITLEDLLIPPGTQQLLKKNNIDVDAVEKMGCSWSQYEDKALFSTTNKPYDIHWFFFGEEFEEGYNVVITVSLPFWF